MSPASRAPASTLGEPLLDPDRPIPPDVSGLVTEDDNPLVNLPCATKFDRYSRQKITYYVVWDPIGYLGAAALRTFELQGLRYAPLAKAMV